MATNVGTLNINIQAGTAQFDQAMNKVQQTLKNTVITGSAIGSAIGELFEHLAEKAGELAKQLVEATLSMIDMQEEMLRLAQAAGTTTEKFSTLAYAGKFSAVSTEELASSMTHLEKTMADAASGNLAARQAFQALGVSITDTKGNLRDTGDVFVDVAKKLSGYRDDANKARLMQDIFGKSGAQLIAMMNDVGKNYDELKKKARELGVVIGTEAGEQASKFNEKMTELKEHLQGIGLQALNQMMPTLDKFADAVLRLADNIGKLVKSLSELPHIEVQIGDKTYKLIDIFNALDKKTEETNEKNQKLPDAWNTVLQIMGNAGAEGIKSWNTVLKIMGLVGGKVTGVTKDVQGALDQAKAAREAAEGKKEPTKDTTTKPSVKLPPDPELAKIILQYKERIKQIEDAIAAQKMLNEVIGQGNEAQAVVNGLIQAENDIRELNHQRTEKHIQALMAEEEANIRRKRVSQELNKASTDLTGSVEQQTQAAALAYLQQKNLTEATVQGADAVREAQLQNQILAENWGKNATALDLLNDKTKERDELLRRAAELARQAQAIERVQQIQAETKALGDEITSINETTAALLQNDAAQDEAERKALKRRQDNELAEQKRLGATQDVIDALKKEQAVARDVFADQQRAQRVQQARQDLQGPEENYEIRKKNLEDEAKLLEETQQHALSYGQTLAYAAQQDDALIAKQQKWIQLLLTSHKAMDGVNAFFLELQVNAKTAAQTVYDVMTTAFEGLSDYLAKVMTGTKASFGDLMRSIAEMIAKAEIQSLLTNLLTPKPGAGVGSSVLGSLFSSIGGLFGHRQAGGPISAGRAWIVGESGPEIITGVSGYVHSAAMTRGMLGGAATVVNYAIDARGTDPVLTERRTRAAIIAAHQSSVATSIQASNELVKRRPPKGA